MKTRNVGNVLLICFVMMAISSYTKPKPLPVIKGMTVNYQRVGNVISKEFIAYDDNLKGKRPAILVVHEWWGLNEYPKMRVRQLAAMGYFAMAVDLFGNGKTAANPKEAQELAGPFYKDPKLIKTQMDYALQKVREYPQVDPANVAVISPLKLDHRMLRNYLKGTAGNQINQLLAASAYKMMKRMRMKRNEIFYFC